MNENLNLDVACPSCGGTEFSKWKEVKDYSITGEVFILADCAGCGLRCTANPPLEAACGKYYESQDYISHSDSKEGLLFRVYHLVRSFMLGRKAALIQKITKGKDLLDVGCGTGYFAAFMSEKGFQVQGIEVDEKARKYAMDKFGMTVSPPSVLLDGRIQDTFDVITLWHVMEHLYNPSRYWQCFHQQLRNSGKLLIAVPNHHGFDAAHYQDHWAGYDVPRHLWHFTPDALISMAQKHGFTFLMMKSMPFDPFYNALLSEKYKKSWFPWFRALAVGFIAFCTGILNTRKASSVIYIFEKSREK